MLWAMQHGARLSSVSKRGLCLCANWRKVFQSAAPQFHSIFACWNAPSLPRIEGVEQGGCTSSTRKDSICCAHISIGSGHRRLPHLKKRSKRKNK